MADENGLQGDRKFEQAAATTSHSEIVESEIQAAEKSKEKKESTNVVPYYKLVSFADPTDYLLMFVGTIAAIGNGACMPIMTILFGQVVNAFGSTSTNTEEVTHEVSQV
jgi:ATP-binding cassette subfamily B (MDR/TAP) protein 1